MKKKKISVVIPCYRSAQTIGFVVEGIVKTMALHTDYDYEVILVNDGSPDNTFEVISSLAEQEKAVIAVDLSRNFGQHSALMAGYAMVTGDYVLGMDDDGEHDPAEMFRLVEELEKGYDYVCAEFTSNDHSLYKRLGSKLNNWMATKFIGKPENALFSSYYIMRRYVMDQIIKSPNPYPYVGGMLVSVTKRLTSIPMEHHVRRAGESGYHFRNSVSLWLNGITAFSVKPLRIASFAGMITAILGFLVGIYIVIRKLIHPEILAGYTSLAALLLVIGGINMVLIGMIGEYVGRIYLLNNCIPQYVIRTVVGAEEEEDSHPAGQNRGQRPCN